MAGKTSGFFFFWLPTRLSRPQHYGRKDACVLFRKHCRVKHAGFVGTWCELHRKRKKPKSEQESICISDFGRTCFDFSLSWNRLKVRASFKEKPNEHGKVCRQTYSKGPTKADTYQSAVEISFAKKFVHSFDFFSFPSLCFRFWNCSFGFRALALGLAQRGASGWPAHAEDNRASQRLGF